MEISFFTVQCAMYAVTIMLYYNGNFLFVFTTYRIVSCLYICLWWLNR